MPMPVSASASLALALSLVTVTAAPMFAHAAPPRPPAQIAPPSQGPSARLPERAPGTSVVVETVRGSERRIYRLAMASEPGPCSRASVRETQQEVEIKLCSRGGQRGTVQFVLQLRRARGSSTMVAFDDMPFDLARETPFMLPLDGDPVMVLVRADTASGPAPVAERAGSGVAER